jgi:predicted dehydrogenase
LSATPEPLRIGLIGAGGIANGAHIPAYRALGSQVRLAACADVNLATAERTAAEHGIPGVYADYRDMLARERLDAVSVCTPNKFHAPAAIAALEAGCHVLCEKPPAISAGEARAMAEAAQRAGRILTFGFMFRFSPEVQAARRYAQDGAFGEIYTGRVTAMRRRGIPSWGVFTNRELQGGGPLIDIGVHMLDAALYVMDYPEPAAVMGVTHTKLGNRPAGVAPWGPWDHTRYSVEDVCGALLTFENGASLLLETSFIANVEAMEELNVRLVGTRAGVRLFPFSVFGEEHGTLTNTQAAWQPQGNNHHREIAHFVRCVRGEAQPVSTPEEAVKIQRIIDAIYRSAESGTSVRA